MGTGITNINSLGLAGLQTAQTGMANIATNVSGAAVEGFHRRETHPLMTSASTNPLVQGGTVIIDSIVRSYSALVSSQYLANHAKVRQAATMNNAAQIMDRMLVDESSGLTEVFNSFFTTASDLSADPASGTARTAFATTSVEMTDRVRNLAATIEETRRQALFQMSGVIDAINDKAEALARVNVLIQSSSAFGKPLPSADLLDERDRLSGQLTDLVGATIDTSDLGQASLRFDGLALVDGGQAARLAVDRNQDGLPTGLIKVALPRGEQNRNDALTFVGALKGSGIVGGEFGGLMRYAEGAEEWLKRLDDFALSFVKFGDPSADSSDVQWYTKVSDGYSLAKLGAYDDEGNLVAGGMFRVDTDGFEVNDSGDVNVLVRSLRPSLTFRSNMTTGAMVPWSTSDDPTASVDQSFVMKAASGRSSLMREWSDWVSGVSSVLSKWRAEEASFTAVHVSLNEQREQISGVDLDQEATDLLRFQQLYQANSSVIQAAMRMFDVLITTTGR
ncbi:MAG: flagellar hook-associated protein FlgK [Betaproteobacteria bacterium]|nr:flagellar hook-associated protein FlgK [Betaproteobacteria bacterium]